MIVKRSFKVASFLKIFSKDVFIMVLKLGDNLIEYGTLRNLNLMDFFLVNV